MESAGAIDERVEWLDDDTPYSVRFKESYYAKEGGLDESRHVFLRGNGLPERFKAGFSIAELGFGTGLNMLAALEIWRASGTEGSFSYTGFERYPLSVDAISRALRVFPSMRALAEPFLDAWSSGEFEFSAPGIEVEIVVGDARRTLPSWKGSADAWFLDGFSPMRNPQLWETGLLSKLAERTAPGGTLATFTAAGQVRRTLAANGFDVFRQQGFGRKRHMISGKRVSD